MNWLLFPVHKKLLPQALPDRSQTAQSMLWQVAAALSESVRERQGIATLKRHLVTLQSQLGEAHRRLHQSQVCTPQSGIC